MNDREQFEAWQRGPDGNCRGSMLPKRDNGDYRDTCTQSDWRVWQAARATPAQPVPSPSSVGAAIPDSLRNIGELLRTQNNRITDQPMFVVQQKRRITGISTDYCENIVWLHSESEYSEADKEEHDALEAEYRETGRQREDWLRTGYQDEWEFVTACFTEQGCKDYLAKDGHNLKEPRIYADGSYRNEEYRAVRNWLMSLAAPSIPHDGQKSEADHV